MQSELGNPIPQVLFLNGKECAEADAKISVFDRGFLYGDSLYEVIRTYHGVPFALKEHLDRLEKSAELWLHKEPLPRQEIEREVKEALGRFQEASKNREADAYVRIILSRGTGKIGFGLGAISRPPTRLIIVHPIEAYLGKAWENGVRLAVVSRIRNHPNALSPAMKSGNYLNNLLAYLEATALGFDDALLCDGEGFLTEGTTFNIFYVKDGIVITPPLDVGVLVGITRGFIERACRIENIPCRAARFKKDRLYSADEVFLASTLKEAYPVVAVDHARIGNGKPGPLTRILRDRVHQLALESLRANSPSL